MKKSDLNPYILEFFLIIFLILFPFLGLLPYYSYALGCLGAILFYLKATDKTLVDLGFNWQALNTKTIIIGIISGVIWIAFIVFVYEQTISHLLKNYVPNYSQYVFIRKGPSFFVMTIITGGWLVGGFYEEIAFRGCIPNILRAWHKNTDSSYVSATILSSLLYGLYYWRFDVYSMIPATLGGIYWSLLIKQFKGNIWYSIISRGTYCTIAYAMIYYNYTF